MMFKVPDVDRRLRRRRPLSTSILVPLSSVVLIALSLDDPRHKISRKAFPRRYVGQKQEEITEVL
jgi:hypothetical protein